MEKLKLQVKGIFLDLDGTIVDSKEAYLEAMKTAMTKWGQKTINAWMATEIPKRLEQNLPMDDLLKGIDTPEFLKTYLDAYYEATVTKTKAMPNVSDTLRRLSEKAKLAVITMRFVPKKVVIEELKRLGLLEHFQQVITALDAFSPKPSPEALLECARILEVKMCECVFVGDSVVDVRTGKAAGTKTVAVLSGIFSREELEKEKPDLILENVKELPDFIE
jgi:HAD superfamily hydrolase (TIGR01509 family)